ncbi:Stp1/IreP family PP2C-type Ser/Thr phosphatase [Dyadobacter psychrotolerans]|nr:Stp1/IreP family PP2C-type Ser/Thr phosphatase [Dyadobacter psychrotolerans]
MFWSKWFSVTSQKIESPQADKDLRAVVISDVGCVRTNNEDTALFFRPASAGERMKKGYLAIIADGMGGHAAGEVASQMAVDIVSKVYYQRNEQVSERLFFAFQKANRQINQSANKNKQQKGMGTTCTALAVCDHKLYLAHVGDSRAYIFKNGQLLQLSGDHTYVNGLLEQGMITAAEALIHPERNVLTKALGTQSIVEVDITEITEHFEAEDRILLCSDGLYDYLSAQEIGTILLQNQISDAAAQLVDCAKQRGGHDNISVILAEYVPSETFQSLNITRQIG